MSKGDADIEKAGQTSFFCFLGFWGFFVKLLKTLKHELTNSCCQEHCEKTIWGEEIALQVEMFCSRGPEMGSLEL